jgi:hypothetical protein
MEILASNYNYQGWEHGKIYSVNVLYSDDKIEVKLGDTTVLQYTPTEPIQDGKVGFLNNSQGLVNYRDFIIRDSGLGGKIFNVGSTICNCSEDEVPTNNGYCFKKGKVENIFSETIVPSGQILNAFYNNFEKTKSVDIKKGDILLAKAGNFLGMCDDDSHWFKVKINNEEVLRYGCIGPQKDGEKLPYEISSDGSIVWIADKDYTNASMNISVTYSGGGWNFAYHWAGLYRFHPLDGVDIKEAIDTGYKIISKNGCFSVAKKSDKVEYSPKELKEFNYIESSIISGASESKYCNAKGYNGFSFTPAELGGYLVLTSHYVKIQDTHLMA